MKKAEFGAFLRAEARRVREARHALHGGTRDRYDLLHWADALEWAARKYDETEESE